MFKGYLPLDSFNVYQVNETGFADEMMLLTHGGYKPGWGWTSLPSPAYFYCPHTVILEKVEAYKVIEGSAGAPNATTIVGPGSSVWNYHLQKLEDEEYNEVMRACVQRLGDTSLTPWDWWEAKNEKLTSLDALAAALKKQGCNYQKIHCLCCRAWLPLTPPPELFGLKAPWKAQQH
jgi:hypothetical protein